MENLKKNFFSILFKKSEDKLRELDTSQPSFFVDLNLDQVIDTITIGKKEYNLKPFFYIHLNDIETIIYRQEIFKELENIALFESIKSFARSINTMRDYISKGEKLYYKLQKERYFLEAVEIYCNAVTSLFNFLSSFEIKSLGLLNFKKYLIEYMNSDIFISLKEETKKLIADLNSIKYCIHIKGNTVKVRKYENEPDYSVEVEATFEKFKQGAVKDYLVKFTSPVDMNHVEARILELVAQLYSDIFSNIDNYCIKNKNFFDETISTFDREIQFYITYIEYMNIFKNSGLNFCYPIISNETKEIYNYDGFDLALAYKLLNENSKIVYNDFYLKDKERIFIVSGPNQGGKTTFARMFGQLHYLATLGCPVTGKSAQLYLFDKLFTHFEKEENIKNLHGKLQDDLISIYNILSEATSNSIIILNEIFNSTTLKDAIFLGKKIIQKIIDLDLICVYVTFIDELVSLSEKIVSMVSNVDPNNTALRTYKILRKPAGGLAYAISIAQKYKLTYEDLKERIKS